MPVLRGRSPDGVVGAVAESDAYRLGDLGSSNLWLSGLHLHAVGVAYLHLCAGRDHLGIKSQLDRERRTHHGLSVSRSCRDQLVVCRRDRCAEQPERGE